MKLSIPSKTFLLGEYNVLYGGSAVLIATEPSFVIENNDIYDPYKGSGGFGLSGAKFIAAYYNERKNLNVYDAIEEFRSKERVQSGSDVVCQLIGNVTVIHPNKTYRSTKWPFKNHELLIFKNTSKVNTHQNIDISKQLDVEKMNRYVSMVEHSMETESVELFSEGVGLFFEYMLSESLVSDSARCHTAALSAMDEVLAVKGCGALCHDAIFTFNYKRNSAKIKSFAKQRGLIYTASSTDIRGGAYVVC